MMKKMLLPALLLLTAATQTAAPPAPARSDPDPGMADGARRADAQRGAMAALSFMDGQWRGTGTAHGYAFTQTERAGTLLDGTVRLVEGRAYGADGTTVFNAFAIIGWDEASRAYVMRSHAMGFAGDFPLAVRPDGYSWEQPMGAGAVLRYTATIANGEWHEVGERIAAGAAPVRLFEMRLRRIGDSPWPAGDPVPAR